MKPAHLVNYFMKVTLIYFFNMVYQELVADHFIFFKEKL